jgi:hypothetical protein
MNWRLTQALAIALLQGEVLQVSEVTAGNGLVIDWRTVRCGETIITDGDAFDCAYLFLALVGDEAAERALHGAAEAA